MLVRLVLLGLVCAFPVGCRTFVDIPENQKGGVFNPVRCDMPAGQRAYLKLLRGPEGQPVQYEYRDAVVGPDGKILDRFLIRNPKYSPARRGLLDRLRDLTRADPDLPPWYRVYMSMYFPGELDREPIPGFKMMSDETPPESDEAPTED